MKDGRREKREKRENSTFMEPPPISIFHSHARNTTCNTDKDEGKKRKEKKKSVWETSSFSPIAGPGRHRVLPLLSKLKSFSEARSQRSESAKKNPNHIKRPLNAFMIFRSKHQARVRRDTPQSSRTLMSARKSPACGNSSHLRRRPR